MSHGIRLLISGTAGIGALFLTLTVFVLFLGSAHWSSPVSSIPGLTSLILGVVTFKRCQLLLTRRYAPDELTGKFPGLK
jgi:hypothetical protein